MKKTKIIIPALGMLLLSTAASVTGTVAWFSMNQSVSVTGMQVKTKVSSNLLITEDTIGSTAIKADNMFASGPLEQEVSEILEPVSTLNAKDFFYTTDANADGSKNKNITGEGAVPYVAYNPSTAATGTDAANYLNKFSQDYGITTTAANALITGKSGAVAYADYVFQLKAVNTDTGSANINLTQLDLTYAKAGEEADTNNAYRIAIFAEEANAPAATVTGAAGTLKGTWKPENGENHGVMEGEPASLVQKVVSGTAAYSNASYVSDDTPIATIASGATKYYKVVVRLFLEGMDKTCTNTTFASLTGSWSLDLKLELGTGTPVTEINLLPARS